MNKSLTLDLHNKANTTFSLRNSPLALILQPFVSLQEGGGKYSRTHNQLFHLTITHFYFSEFKEKIQNL